MFGPKNLRDIVSSQIATVDDSACEEYEINMTML